MISTGCRNIIFCLSLSLVCISFNSVFAALSPSEEAVREIERRQYETEKKLREKERIGIELEKKEAEQQDKATPPADDGNRFLVHEIILQNDELLSWLEKRNLLKPYLDKKISYNDITVLVRSITNILIDKGYITARVKVPLDQNIKSGVFILTIVNGYIEDIVPAKDSIRDSLQIFTAFPFLTGGYLNIKDLDYGIEQMNRLKSNNATMKVIPGEDLGSSKVVIYNEPAGMLGFDIGCDNLGQKTTGEYRGKISANIDNLLSINDNLSFDTTRTMNGDDDRKFSRSYTMFFSLPFGYWTLSSTYSRSESLQYVKGMNTDFKTSGNDTSRIVSLDRMLGRYKFNRFKAKASLTLKDKENFIEDVMIETSSRKLSIMKAGLDYSSYLFDGFFSTSAFYHKGLKAFDAYEDTGDLQDDTPRAQFEKYELGIIWNKPFSFFDLNFGYMFNFSGQYGMDTLYSSEKITLGDMNTVRGFQNDSFAGDRGFYIRNDLSVFDFSSVRRYLRGVKLIVSYDYGYAIEKTGKDANYGEGEGSIMGWSTGIAYSSKVINMNITYSRQLFSPWFVKEKEYVVYCSATASLTGIFDETWNFFSKNEVK